MKTKQANLKTNICVTDNNYYVMYAKKIAKNNKDICVQPSHGATWLYSSKDPGSALENVVIATNDPEVLKRHPQLGKNKIFNDFVNTLNNESL